MNSVMKIYFIITGHNCGELLAACFGSLLRQTSNQWHAIYVDDASTDNTLTIAQDHYFQHPHFFTILANETRALKSYGFLRAINGLSPNIIIAELDGDDELINIDTVSELIHLHTQFDLVYTNHTTTNFSKREWIKWRSTPLPPGWTRSYPIREAVWDINNFPGHLRTFKKFLFDQIDQADFVFNGELLKVAFDLVYYTILLEMTPTKKIYFHDKNCYHYKVREMNDQFIEDDLIAIGKKDEQHDMRQTQIDIWLKNKSPYLRH